MPILFEFFIICAVFFIVFEGVYGYVNIFIRQKTTLLRKVVRYFCMLIATILVLAHFVVPKIAYEYLGAKEVIEKLNPKWLLSDQPDIVRLEKTEKWLLFASQTDLFTKMIISNIVHFPTFAFNYFLNLKTVQGANNAFFGVAIDPVKNDLGVIMPALKELGAKSVLMRLHYGSDAINSPEYQKTLYGAQALNERGYETLIVLAQNKEAFKQDANLTLYFESVFKDFGPYVKEFQIGETINRPKWGVIRFGEYENFFREARAARDKFAPNAKLAAPSVIDFEWLYAIYFANAIGDYDILNSLLYVDRVGMPENTQMGADTSAKIRLMSAINPSKPFYITEFNWPLSGSGEYKPTSDAEAVNEYLHACYGVRYALLALGSNQTSKIYYWQLMAKGYGLIDHLNLEKKAAFRGYQTMIRMFDNASSTTLAKLNEKCYSLKSDAPKKVEAMWCVENSDKKIQTPPNYKYFDMFGAEIKNPTLGVAPIYAVEAPSN